MARAGWVVGVVVAGVGVAGLARPAAAERRSIVLEAYTGSKPERAQQPITTVLGELATRGFTVGYDGFGRAFEADVSRAARSPQGLPADFLSAIDRGHKAWTKGRFEEAVAILTPLVEAARINAAVVAQDQGLRESLLRGLVDLALAHQRNGDAAAARETMGDVVRSYPVGTVSRATYGPEAFELYEATRKQLGTTGGLVVTATDERTALFINEHFGRVGLVQRTGVVPGTYRVYAVVGQREGRVHRIEVKPNTEAKLTIDWAFDSALHLAPDWSGLVFASTVERDRQEPAFAARFAKLVGASAVAVVGVDEVRGRPAIVGSLVGVVSGRELRRASIALDPEPSTARLRALARFLAGDESARRDLDDVEVMPAGDRSEVRAPEVPPPPRRWGAWKWVAAVGGVALLGTGGALVYLDGRCREEGPNPGSPCARVWGTGVPGYVTLGAGAAALGLGIYMFATDRPRARTAVILPTRDGVMAWATLTF